MVRRALVASLLFGVLLAPVVPHAGEDDELERLREAVLRGQVLPLSTLREKLRARFPGEIVKTELDIEDGRFVYEFKVLQSGGQLLEIEMDAATGEIVDVEDDD